MSMINLEERLRSYFQILHNEYEAIGNHMIEYMYQSLFPDSEKRKLKVEDEHCLYSHPIRIEGWMLELYLYVDLYNRQFFLLTGCALSDEDVSVLLRSRVFKTLVYVMFYMKENVLRYR